mmetsp:Transcript_19525/g.30130  ORF Transcript_19525/g.30130 Transcript_19525/m.30130 type:complete len:191 (-) Transcript_19525:55-627(-)
MKISHFAFLTTLVSRRVTSFTSTSLKVNGRWGGVVSHPANNNLVQAQYGGTNSRRYLSSGGFDGEPPQIAQIGMEQMEEIIEDLNEAGREETGYFVIDVRGYDEVAYTGKLSEKVYTIPVQVIMEKNAFAMEEDDFEEEYGFKKPDLDETLVFSCKAGIRSQAAAQMAAMNGYSNLVNYQGGADEWFRSR